MQNDRGTINNRDRGRQIRDYSGLKYGNITPTDIDGFLDFHNKIFIFFELKYGDAELPIGQRLALERLCDATGVEVISYAFIAKHYHPVEEDIDAARAVVTKIRHRGLWTTPKQERTLKQHIDEILNRNNY